MSEIKVSTFDGALAELDVDVLLLPVFEAADSAGPWESLDEAVEGRISEAIASRPFSGKLQKYLAVPLPTGGGPGEILLVGLGEAGKLTSFRYREAIAGGTSLAVRRRAERIAIAAREDAKFGAEHAAAATEAVLLSQYRFDRYKKPDEDATRLAELLQEPLGGQEYAAALADVFPHDEDGGVAAQLLAHRLTDGFDDGHGRAQGPGRRQPDRRQPGGRRDVECRPDGS